MWVLLGAGIPDHEKSEREIKRERERERERESSIQEIAQEKLFF